VGAVAGPVGAAVGAVAGGIIGGLAGKGIAESIDPTTEEAYWSDQYPKTTYYDKTVGYEEYRPAYRYGVESRLQHHGRRFDDVEHELSQGWNTVKGKSQLTWDRARHASRDAWNRVEETLGSRPAQ